MKVKQGFALQPIAGSSMAVVMGNIKPEEHLLIRLNKTGEFLWEFLERGTDRAELVNALIMNYDVSETKASEDVDDLLAVLNAHSILE